MVDLFLVFVVLLVLVWVCQLDQEIDIVVYSFWKLFFWEEGVLEILNDVNDVQFDCYYKNFMQGMGEMEKVFFVVVSWLGCYLVEGGFVVWWEIDGIYIDMFLNLYDFSFKIVFVWVVNNMVYLVQVIYCKGIFKSCLFNVCNIFYIDCIDFDKFFWVSFDMSLYYEVSVVLEVEDEIWVYFYFEDGFDFEEFLVLLDIIIRVFEVLNNIYYIGMIIFEVLFCYLKIYSYYWLLDLDQEVEFSCLFDVILLVVEQIIGFGVFGFMKMFYKDIWFFFYIECFLEKYYFCNFRVVGQVF